MPDNATNDHLISNKVSWHHVCHQKFINLQLKRVIENHKDSIFDLANLTYSTVNLFSSPSYFSSAQLMFPSVIFWPQSPVPLPPSSRSVFHSQESWRKKRLSKKSLLPVSLHTAVKGQGHGQGLLISFPGLLKTKTA